MISDDNLSAIKRSPTEPRNVGIDFRYIAIINIICVYDFILGRRIH